MWNLHYNMKAILFYFTAILTVILLCMEISFAWTILAIVDIMLITLSHKYLSIRDVVKYSGYSAWYRMLRV